MFCETKRQARFSFFSRTIGVLLIVVFCAAIVPSSQGHSDSENCNDEYWDIWEAAGIAVFTCGGGVLTCASTIASGGITVGICFATSGLCYYAAKNIADKMIAYWDCKDRLNQNA
jgi:hypothetical protein